MDYRKEFPIFENIENYYLDTAATSQKPKRVLDKMMEYYKKYNGNPGRGSHTLSMEASGLLTEARETVRKFINAERSEEVIFTKNTTESINLIAYSYGMEFLNEGDEIVLGISNHHANIVPWQFVAKKKKSKIKYVYLDDNGQFDLNDFKYKLSDKTKIVSVSGVVNVTGVIQPVKEIIEAAHKKNALVLVDAAQSILHFRHDVQELGADFLVFSGHKLFAPMGIGVMYGKKEVLDSMPPFLYGGDMIEFVTEQESTFAPLPNKFEGGTQNVEGAVALKEAINFIEEIGYDRIDKIEKELAMKALFEIKRLGFVETYCTENVERTGIIAFNVQGVHSHDVAFILDSYNVAVRSGHHCAQPLMNYVGIPSCCRASFGIYNSDEDIAKLVEGLKKIKEVFGI
ncbi:SufS family cysteine desulfurase [Leptotrichia sp. OH3620_COT-345]|uniref:SufS family cysteine desulfurase n=1 Tax=Leptotrichia sp. OH3620_COT-345 TaxID=2491048 RepID=UPI000F64FEEF|nr:SufS family cysteine desulfurase [Leptotrichia sp. OH3620_COT-345]RRD38081.1 SufS family cysteine desulfurase [Leptotrichia sp. OH3620_COT-345]